MLRRLISILLEPARDPLRDSFGLSLERVAALRERLHTQIVELRARAGSLRDAAFESQIRQLEAEHEKLIAVEKRAGAELDSHRARQDLLSARLTAAQAQDHIRELIGALDDAHARAAALAEAVQFDS
jgi:phage shock protein A